ncbi:MAG: Lrp/AsnC family transcriptional regulator [Desulfosarcina sp.]|nr:Lrp/AsnC family transcriptional regulator [Desulfosarcina sp.]MBC2766521.1 Lrp/AsnC family transcriptional regulator [Desulfosarcina sp.]
MLTDLEKKVIASIQGDIPIVARPYQVLAEEIGIPEETFIETLQNLTEQGVIRASFRAVSHCYRRDPADGWPYNLYTMIHGKNEKDCRNTARKMSEKSGVPTYQLLFSRRELKKISMTYFSDAI